MDNNLNKIDYIDSTRVGTIINDYTAALNTIYPIGSIYKSTNSTSPASMFGGTWEQIQGRFLIGQNSTYTNGSVGGYRQRALSTTNLPSHGHTISASINNAVFQIMRDGGWAGGGGTNVSYSQGTGTSRAKLDGTIPSNQRMDTVNIGFQFATKTTANTGSSTAINTLPPYLVVYMWKRVS